VDAPLTYRLDADDRIVDIRGPWDEFARANGAPELTRDKVLEHSLFGYVGDATTIEIYRQILARVRRTGEPATVAFRCDGAAQVREMALEVKALSGAEIELESRVVAEKARPAVPLFEPRPAAGEELLAVCSWCKDGQRPDGSWTDLATLAGELGLFRRPRTPRISHGICPRCESGWRAELEAGA
jgi:hypothetical protein